MRSALAVLIACMPGAALRRWLYGVFRGYDIHRTARIGWLTVVDVESLSMAAGSSIGRGTWLRGPMRVELAGGSALGGRSRVECGTWFTDFETPDAPWERALVLGERAMTTTGHYFDAVGGIHIGEGSWIAGYGSQFWTHGLGATDRSISIGRYSYIGSAVRFAPGARVGDLSVVGLGSVVTADFSDLSEVLIAGCPAEVVRDSYRISGWSSLERGLDEGRIGRPEA